MQYFENLMYFRMRVFLSFLSLEFASVEFFIWCGCPAGRAYTLTDL